MANDNWVAKRIAETEKELAAFDNAVAKHGLRVVERDATGTGERDVTDIHRRRLHTVLEDYRRLLLRMSDPAR
jgi:hypothetical protein